MSLQAEHVALTTRNNRTLIWVYLNDCPIREPHKTEWYYTRSMFYYHPLGKVIDPALEWLLQLLYSYQPLLTAVRLTAADNAVRLQLSQHFLADRTPMQKLVAITALLQPRIWIPSLQVSYQAATEYTEVDSPAKRTWQEILDLVKEFMFLEAMNAHLRLSKGATM